MKPASIWIIRLALTVQFLGVLAVPAIIAAAESPRGDEHVVSIMEPDPTPASAKKAGALIERAMQSQTAISR